MKELAALRKELAAIDRQLYELFARRMAVADQVAAYKMGKGSPIYAPAQEDAILSRVRGSMPRGLEDYGAALARTLLRLSRERQYELAVERDEDWRLSRILREAARTSASWESIRAGGANVVVLPEEAALQLLAAEELFIQARLDGDSPLLVLGRELTVFAGAGQAGLFVELGPELTALELVVGILADLGLTVVNLQSAGERLFLEFVAEPASRSARRALYQLDKETAGMRFLGWYPVLQLD